MKKIVIWVIICLFFMSSNTFAQGSTSASSATFWYLPLENVVVREFKLGAIKYYDLLVVKFNEDSSALIEKHVYIESSGDKNKMILSPGKESFWVQSNKMTWNGTNWVKASDVSEKMKKKIQKHPDRYPTLDLVCNWGKQVIPPAYENYDDVYYQPSSTPTATSKKSTKPGYNLVK